ncbi:MAG TPA: M3 family oligoendopeptidase [Anaerolineales bacterium]|nr:M3 family oligoendopeptidase [Anaerolineales bacterium]
MSTNYETGAWSLDELLPAPNSPEYHQRIEAVETAVKEIESLRSELSEQIDSETFLHILSQYEQISTHMAVLSGYANLRFAEDTQNEQALAFLGKIEELGTDIQNRTLFFDLWWKSLDDAIAAQLQASARQYQYFLTAMRLSRAHILPENEEQVINIKNANGSQALVKIYEMLTNAYKFNLIVNGETKEITRDELMVFVKSPDPALRAAAYQELYRVFGQDGMVLTQIYIHLVRDWFQENQKLRQYASPIAVRNLANDIPDSAVQTLLQVCRTNAVVFQRWFKIKARWAGMEKLRRYDLYAPLSESETHYSYDRAVKLVLECVEEFSPEVRAQAEQIFTAQHVHSSVSAGKMGGAFCYGITPEHLPWLLVNYNGKQNDVLTLAHELGHGIHDILAGEQNTILTHQACLPLAETASTFAEMLVTDRLLATANAQERQSILGSKLDDLYATIQRQAFFAIWEQTAHQMIQQGASVGELTSAYLDNLREQFGDSVEISEDFKWESIAIPHFVFAPFYVYAYAFGQLLVLSLYQRYKREGSTFVPHYLKILRYGGGASPKQILTEAGVDIDDPNFWQGGFDYIAGLLDELEQ